MLQLTTTLANIGVPSILNLQDATILASKINITYTSNYYLAIRGAQQAALLCVRVHLSQGKTHQKKLCSHYVKWSSCRGIDPQVKTMAVEMRGNGICF